MDQPPATDSHLSRLKWAIRRNRVGFFCDFDGTISEKDMIGAIMMKFVPEAAEPIIRAVKSQQASVQSGVSAMFRLLPMRRFVDIQAFATDSTVIRKGFHHFVDFCREHGFALSVVSGGFDFFVEPALTPFTGELQIYCNKISGDGEHMEVQWPYPCDADCDGGCGLCKPSIVRSVRDKIDSVIVIGDGVTDYKVAALADFVFARDKLLDACRREGLPHAAFDTFDDILATIRHAME